MTKMMKLEMKKLQYDINREAAKISTLSSGKVYKYQYFTGEQQNKLNLPIIFYEKLQKKIKNDRRSR